MHRVCERRESERGKEEESKKDLNNKKLSKLKRKKRIKAEDRSKDREPCRDCPSAITLSLVLSSLWWSRVSFRRRASASLYTTDTSYDDIRQLLTHSYIQVLV